jgi:predicted porin
MKKTLVALAAFAATAAFAQSSVTIFGNIDQTVYRQTDSGKSAQNIASAANTTSTLGFKGTEDLGAGLKANFFLNGELSLKEGQMGSTTSGNAAASGGQKPNIFTRGATVGLSSNKWGSVDVGRVTDSAWQTQGSLNNTGSNSFGWNAANAISTNPAGVTAFNGSSFAADTTFSGTTATSSALGTANQAQTGSAPFNFGGGYSYTSPNIGGVVGSIQSFGSTNSAGTTKAGSGMAYSLNYAAGPLKLAYGSTYRNGSNGEKAYGFDVFGGSYKVGQYTFVAGRNTAKFSGTLVALPKLTTTGLGVTYDVNAQVDVAFGLTSLKDDAAAQSKTNWTGLTARYKFSPRTQAYAGWGKAKNEGASNKSSTMYAGSNAFEAGVTPTAYLVGIRHSF